MGVKVVYFFNRKHFTSMVFVDIQIDIKALIRYFGKYFIIFIQT